MERVWRERKKKLAPHESNGLRLCQQLGYWPHHDYLLQFLTHEQWRDWSLLFREQADTEPQEVLDQERNDLSKASDEEKRQRIEEIKRRAAEAAAKVKEKLRGKHRKTGDSN